MGNENLGGIEYDTRRRRSVGSVLMAATH